MADVTVNITPGGPANRVEVIIRIFYTMIVGFILYFFMLAAYILVTLEVGRHLLLLCSCQLRNIPIIRLLCFSSL